MGFAKLAVAATILGAASVSAQSIAFTSRPVIKVGSGQMKVKAVMAYDFATHSGFCPGGEAPAIRTRFRSAADSAAAGILNSYPLATARSRGDAKQAITVSSYVSGQHDLQIEAWVSFALHLTPTPILVPPLSLHAPSPIQGGEVCFHPPLCSRNGAPMGRKL